MSPRIVDKDAKRAEILDAAIRAFARSGFHATKTEDIAREAGVANGTIYRYFTSRDDILIAAFDRFDGQVSAGVEAAVRTDRPADERLRAVVRALLSGTQAEPELSRLMLDWARRVPEGPQASDDLDVGRVYASYRETISGLLEQAKREGSIRADLRDDVPAVIVAAVEGVLLQWIVDPAAVIPQQACESVLDVLFDGLR